MTEEELVYRLRVAYAEAISDLSKKIDKYLKKFEKKDAEMRALYDSGVLSHEDYMSWRFSAIAGSKQWEDMRSQLTFDMVHVDQIASDIINDAIPEMYAEGHNYGTYEAEIGSGWDTTYTLYNRDTVALLMEEGKIDLLPVNLDIPRDEQWNRQHIQSAITQGILQGEPMQKIADRLQSVVGMDERAAIRNARTAVTGAQNAGHVDSYIRAEKMGIKLKQMWIATLDGRTRDSHAMLDGQQREVGKEFSNGCRYPGDAKANPSEIYNCFIGDTKIATDSEIIRSYKYDYSGELFTVKTASGVEFTCTPNHPIFTPRGWISVNTLHKSDNIFITFVSDNHFTGSNPDINHIFPCIDTIHNFPDVIGRKRIGALSVNFHGDVPTSEVEIVTHKRFLESNINTILGEKSKKFIFKNANESTMSEGTFAKHFRRVRSSTFGFMRRRRKPLSFFWRSVCHSGKHSFRTISWSDSVILQSQFDNTSGNVQFSGDGFNRPSCEVFVDNIIDIKISTVSHVPVYNLQTDKNYYFVSSIISESTGKCNGIPMVIAHNCRCRLVAMVEGADPYSPDLRPSKYLKDQGLTYDEWKRMHEERYLTKKKK